MISPFSSKFPPRAASPERFSIASLESAFLPSIVDKLLDELFIEHHDGQLPSCQPLSEIAK
jgi:hypothetical protein